MKTNSVSRVEVPCWPSMQVPNNCCHELFQLCHRALYFRNLVGLREPDKFMKYRQIKPQLIEGDNFMPISALLASQQPQ
jgi:hypothetical protein